jgi:hypothetical protein
MIFVSIELDINGEQCKLSVDIGPSSVLPFFRLCEGLILVDGLIYAGLILM